MKKENIIIFDTTLRDGAQSPGNTLDSHGKFVIAQQLEKLGVDVIEAGFPISSPINFQTIQKISSFITKSIICALARANEKDIEIAAQSISSAKYKRIHTFIATSPIHMEKKLQLSTTKVLEKAYQAVLFARNFSDDVEFSAEDAFRSDFSFLVQVIEKVIQAGAKTINLPDTVGYATPEEYGLFFKKITTYFSSSSVIFSTHCHDDLGMAVANSLSGIQNGARQIECSINGLGERAGNASLEEIVMAIKTRNDIFPFHTNIQHQEILKTSRLVSQASSFLVPKNKAIVGENAFSHESGIHQDGVLKSKDTYEIMKPEDIGWSSNRIILGKNSGKSALKNAYLTLGYSHNNDILWEKIFSIFKEIAEEKHFIQEDDLFNILKKISS